jgi:hypothetical protein
MFVVGRMGSVSRARGIETREEETCCSDGSVHDDVFVLHCHDRTLNRVRHELTKVVGSAGRSGRRARSPDLRDLERSR